MLINYTTQTEIEMVTLEELVPKDHLVRKIDKVLDLNFICERVAHIYCPHNGWPVLDPVVFFKILLGYLLGIRSERQLMRKIGVNLAHWLRNYPML